MPENNVDTSDAQVALMCMYVSRSEGQADWPSDWRKRVNDLIRALRDENKQLKEFKKNIEEKCCMPGVGYYTEQ